MKIKIFKGGYDKNLCYLIWCNETKYAALIDASVEINPILEYIQAQDLILSKVIITHTHFDHIAFLDDIQNIYPLINVYSYYQAHNLKTSYIGLIHNQLITLGNHTLIALYTPGHFIDSICLWNKEENQLFTGDTMFVGRTGRTMSKESNIKDLYNSTYDIILKLPLKTIIYPGHHYGYKKNIILNDNIKLSKFFQCKSFKDFILVMQNYEKSR